MIAARDLPKGPEVPIIRAHPSDTSLVAAVIGSAFQELDVARWIIAADDDREETLAANMEIWVQHAFDTGGVVDMTADRTGVAVWFINDGQADDLPPDYEKRLDDACGAYADRFRLLDQAFAENHPRDVPHHHLAFMAVVPHAQGNGVGTALLEHHYNHYPDVDSYLEASCRDSRNLYLRHGFQDLSEPFTLPWGGPPMWSMWRPRASVLPAAPTAD